FTAGNPAAPEGSQVAFLQMNGTISQTVNLTAPGTYTVSFKAAQRANYQATFQSIQVWVDGFSVATITPVDTNYRDYATGSFTVAAGLHMLAFQGWSWPHFDNTAFID